MIADSRYAKPRARYRRTSRFAVGRSASEVARLAGGVSRLHDAACFGGARAGRQGVSHALDELAAGIAVFHRVERPGGAGPGVRVLKPGEVGVDDAQVALDAEVAIGQRGAEGCGEGAEFLAGGGDCEDFALAKYFLLREFDIPASDMRVVVALDRSVGEHHALLVVRQADTDGAWLLDTDNRIHQRKPASIRYEYAVNEEGVWDHAPDRQAR